MFAQEIELILRNYCLDREAWAASAQSFILAVSASNNRDHTPWTLHCCLFAACSYGWYSSWTSRLWWIAQSTLRRPTNCTTIRSTVYLPV